MTEYTLSSLVWSILGFMCGFAFAKVWTPKFPGMVRAVTTFSWNKAIAVILIVLALLTTGQAFWFSAQQRRIAECQDKANAELRAVGREERRDYFETWRKILNSPDRETSKKLFTDHLNRGDEREAQRDEAEKTRKRCE